MSRQPRTFRSVDLPEPDGPSSATAEPLRTSSEMPFSTCSGPNATIDPIFQLDPSGKVLKSLGAGLFVSPHKLTIDKDGNLWLADNGGSWAAVRIDVVGVRIGRRPTPEITHLQAVG